MTSTPADARTILLVEDQTRSSVLPFLTRRLDEPRFSITRVVGAEEAVRRLALSDFDLIVVDLVASSDVVTSEVTRLLTIDRSVPIIVITPRSDETLAAEVLNSGVEDFLVRDEIDDRQLLRAIRYAIERHRYIRELRLVTRELQAANQNLERLALIDPLTELLNRRGLQNALSGEIERMERESYDVGVVLIDIDEFKQINDRLGYAVGDVALKEIARHLRRSVRTSDFVARLGGDEFMMLLPHTPREQLARIGERLRVAVAGTLIQNTTGPLTMTASIAVDMLESSTPSIDELLLRLHTMLGSSKRRGRNRVASGNAEFDDTDIRSRARKKLCSDLSRGEGIEPVRQPIFRLSDEEPVGYEYLTRFDDHSSRKPDQIFRMCAELNALTPVDHACMRRAVADVLEKRVAGRIHVNVFPSTLLAIPPRHLISLFIQSGDIGRFCIEISEQQIIGEPSYLIEPVSALREAGFRIAIDDVGWGHSCLESLILLAPDIIKIDKSCAINLADDEEKIRRMRRYVGLTAQLGAELIVEGIETREDLAVLQSIGVEYGQGFLWGRPHAEAIPITA